MKDKKKMRFPVSEVCLAAIFLGCAFWAVSCGTARKVTPTLTEREHLEIRTRTVFVPDTVHYRLPLVELMRETRDTASHLENEYAWSDASVDRAGTLRHTLSTKPQDIPVPTESRVEYRDSIVYREKEVRVPEPYPVEVPAKLNAWQRFRLRSFWPLVLLTVGPWVWKYRGRIAKFFLKVIGFLRK